MRGLRGKCPEYGRKCHRRGLQPHMFWGLPLGSTKWRSREWVIFSRMGLPLYPAGGVFRVLGKGLLVLCVDLSLASDSGMIRVVLIETHGYSVDCLHWRPQDWCSCMVEK